MHWDVIDSYSTHLVWGKRIQCVHHTNFQLPKHGLPATSKSGLASRLTLMSVEYQAKT